MTEGLAVVAELNAQLHAIDWSFSDSYTRSHTHSIHPYPAKFIPQIPRHLIAALYPKDGTAILDPFCGSGTTLVEAALVGAPCIGIDVNPLACLISKVKVTSLSSPLREKAKEIVGRAMNAETAPPMIPALDHWFRNDIQRAVASLMAEINRESNLDARDAFRVAISSILVRVSNQESDTRYAAIEKSVTPADVWSGFLQSVKNIEEAVASTWQPPFGMPRVAILNRDILSIRPEEISPKISLVVTSPPYPNAYEYWLYHKYRMYWLGMDPIAAKGSEIGARAHYFKRDPHTAEDFERNMLQVFKLLSRVMVDGGHACFQIGASIIRGKSIDNAEILIRAASESGFRLVERLRRTIPDNRKSFNLSHARIRDEALLVFGLEAQ